jgi:spore coat-associated protein N
MSAPTRPPRQDKDVPTTTAGQEEQPGARKRAGYMLRHGKLWIGALILLVLAAIVAAASLAAFTTSEANAGNVAATGSLSLSNEDNKVIFDQVGMVPGDTATGTVEIKNTGSVAGNFSLDASAPTDTGSSALSEVLDLKIQDEGAGTIVYQGPFANQPENKSLGRWAADEAHTYRFTVTLRSGTGNTYQNAATRVTYTWTATAGT